MRTAQSRASQPVLALVKLGGLLLQELPNHRWAETPSGVGRETLRQVIPPSRVCSKQAPARHPRLGLANSIWEDAQPELSPP
jgi:hypothetical protein